MAKSSDDAGEFRLRPGRPRAGGKSESRAWSTALRTVLRYARSSQRTNKGSRRKRRLKAHRSLNQRCAVRAAYSSNRISGQWRAHGRYIGRESAGGHPFGRTADAGAGEVHEVANELDRWQKEGDPRVWKLIVSPEFGDRVDLDRLAHDLVSRMEKDLRTKLEWVAVTHFNTEHPHIHLAIRGIRQDKTPLDLPRDYVRRGIRSIAEDFCTRQLGYRTWEDAIEAQRREIEQRRFTSLDRSINRGSASSLDSSSPTEYFNVVRVGDDLTSPRSRNIDGRLAFLQAIGLAEATGPREWRVRRDFESVLKAMQRALDRQRTLMGHGAVLSDERLPMSVLDMRRFSAVEGRVLGHGEEESGAIGRHYLLLESTDANVRVIYYTPELEEARSRGKLRTNSFIRLQKQFENGRPVLEVADFGNAERVLRDKTHFRDRVRLFLDHGAEPLEGGWGGWLGRYQTRLVEAASAMSSRQMVREESRER